MMTIPEITIRSANWWCIDSGRIPRTADEFPFQHFQFEVMDMDGARVDKVLVKKMDEPKEAVTEA